MGKKNKEIILEFSIPKTGIKKPTDSVLGLKSPSFKIEQIPFNDNKDEILYDIKKNIYELELGKCLIIDNSDTGLKMKLLKKRISSIAFNHKQKYIEKDFSLKQINSITLRLSRTK